MKNTLKDELDLLPYFLDKSEPNPNESKADFAEADFAYADESIGSNIQSHTFITNKSLINLRDYIRKLEESRDLIKPISIHKEQYIPYVYSIIFKINLNEIKTVKIEKKEPTDSNYVTVLYQEYTENNTINTFEYTYNYTSNNIIPKTLFKLTVTTFNEYSYIKGFPENDIKDENNYEFNHDYSIDKIGLFLGIHRKNYVKVTSDKYSQTEPSYNDKLTEDDYNYIKRLKYFIDNFNKIPLPILYVTMLFGVKNNISLVNREKKLIKMCKDRFNGVCTSELLTEDKCYFGELPDNDNPLSWEHRNLQFISKDIENVFLEIIPNTYNPLEDENILFKIILRNSLGKIVNDKYTVVPYIKNSNNVFQAFTENNNYILIRNKTRWELNHSLLLNPTTNVLKFKIFNSNNEALEELGLNGLFVEYGNYTEDISITIKSCQDANYFVSYNGNDVTGDGTIDNPFATISKAVSLSNDGYLIVIKNGTLNITETIEIDKNLTILGCQNTSPVLNTTLEHIFSLIQGKILILNNISIINGNTEYNIDNSLKLFNESNNNYNAFILSNDERDNTETLYPIEE